MSEEIYVILGKTETWLNGSYNLTINLQAFSLFRGLLKPETGSYK